MSEPQIATKETFRADLERLVANFAANEDELTSPGFPETECRTQFITPFFRALGWDVENRAGKPFREQEVLEERGPTSEGRPDYTFRIGGVPKFFVEAKAPHEDLDSERHVMQVKRYAWSTKEVFAAILTDFSEFRFYDASLQPDAAHAHRGLIYNFGFREYLDHLDDLWSFSRTRVAEGSIEALLPRDKQSLRFRKPPDDAFLEDMTRWRTELAGAVHKRNPRLSAEELTSVVQRLLDRLIFIRVAEDRHILEKHTLRDRAELWGAMGGRKSILAILNELFHIINHDFNGEIFKPHFCEEINLDGDSQLQRIITELYIPKSNYRFDAISVDIFGAVYERYLGKTIYVKGKKIDVDEKPEVRKAGGVYYTPKYIVDYIVKNTVGKLIEGKSPDEIEAVKILDPACGSGSFLLGAYQYLIDYHRDWYEKHPKKADAGPLIGDVSRDSNNNLRPSIWRKGKILSNNIFGVDLDPQAVEITMMNLYLKALEDERDLPRNKRVLPPLAENMKCGNSLIAPDIAEHQPTLTPEELHRLRPFDWQKEFPKIMQSGGFHAVIGNPPYVQLSMKEFRNDDVNEYLVSRFESSMGRLNTFGLFLEEGRGLLRAGGSLGYIIPNTFLTQGYYEELRRRILTESALEQIVLLTGPVFDQAVVENILIVLSKPQQPVALHKNSFRLVELNADSVPVRSAHYNQEEVLGNYKHAFFTGFDKQLHSLKHKLSSLRDSFGSLTNINQAIALKHDRAAALTRNKQTEKHKPVLDGRDIARYYVGDARYYFKFDVRKIHSCKREDIFLVPEKLFFRRVGSSIIAALDMNKNYALNTLVVVTPKPQCKWSLRVLLALFNSTLLNFYYVNFLKSSKKVFSEIQARQIGQLPVAKFDEKHPSTSIQGKLVKLVDEMIEVQKALHSKTGKQSKAQYAAEAGSLQRMIDSLVYELYGLTKEEIKLVEDALP